MLRRVGFCVVLGLCCVRPMLAADALDKYFAGKSAVVKIDMPGSDKGIDLDFSKTLPLDYKDYSARLTSFGVAIHKGDSAQITKVAVSKDSIVIELNGGGSNAGDAKVSSKQVEKSAYEKDLEKQLSQTKDATQKAQIQENLDKEVARREREQAQNDAAAAAAARSKDKQVADARAHTGSRFNVHFKASLDPFKDVVPAEDKTPDGLKKLLADYLDFTP
jgi:hypothetical protein